MLDAAAVDVVHGIAVDPGLLGGVGFPLRLVERLTDATLGHEGELVVQREDDEQNSWDLVCLEFTISVRADGYAPIEGNYLAWRGPFCASGEAGSIEFRMDATP